LARLDIPLVVCLGLCLSGAVLGSWVLVAVGVGLAALIANHKEKKNNDKPS